MLLIMSDFLETKLHGHIFLIIIYFQEHGLLGARGNLDES